MSDHFHLNASPEWACRMNGDKEKWLGHIEGIYYLEIMVSFQQHSCNSNMMKINLLNNIDVVDTSISFETYGCIVMFINC